MALKAIQRDDEHHFDKQKEFDQRKKSGMADVLFFGDSLTRRWEDYPEVWEKFFRSFQALNFGVGADTLENMFWRITEGKNLEGISPKVVVFLAGTNNLSEQSRDQVLEGIKELILEIRKSLPRAKMFISGLYPRNRDDINIDYGSKIEYINRELELFCAEQGFRFRDFTPLLRSEKGEWVEEIQPDGLHLNDKGYSIIGPFLKEEIEALL